MFRVKLKVEQRGLRELERELKRMNKLSAYKVANKAMKSAMLPVRAELKQVARQFNKTASERRDRGLTPGAMIKQIKMKSRRPRKSDALSVLISGKKLADVRVGVFINKSRALFKDQQKDSATYLKRPAFYAGYLENTGFTDRGGRFHRPLHWIEGVFRRQERQVLSRYTRNLRSALNGVV